MLYGGKGRIKKVMGEEEREGYRRRRGETEDEAENGRERGKTETWKEESEVTWDCINDSIDSCKLKSIPITEHQTQRTCLHKLNTPQLNSTKDKRICNYLYAYMFA